MENLNKVVTSSTKKPLIIFMVTGCRSIDTKKGTAYIAYLSNSKYADRSISAFHYVYLGKEVDDANKFNWNSVRAVAATEDMMIQAFKDGKPSLNKRGQTIWHLKGFILPHEDYSLIDPTYVAPSNVDDHENDIEISDEACENLAIAYMGDIYDDAYNKVTRILRKNDVNKKHIKTTKNIHGSKFDRNRSMYKNLYDDSDYDC